LLALLLYITITILHVLSCSDLLLFTARLSQWLRKKNVDMPSDADNGPTSALRCCHGHLLPEHAPGAKRVSVPENLWLFLYETIRARKADDIVTFPSDCQPCEICSQELSDVASVEGNLR
jgi:ubiquitin carboxyl-terminal hydrolase 48